MKANQNIKRPVALGSAFAALVLAVGIHGEATAQTHEIYKLMPNTALSGVIDPNMEDRTSVKKAWPKTPANPKSIQVGWSEITLGNPWFVELINGAKRTATKYNINLDVQVADGDLQRQCAHIDTFITKKVDLMVVDPTDVLGSAACINRAVDAGIPVVALGTVPDKSARIITTVLANPYGNGFEAGRYVARTAGKDAAITSALILGTVGNSTSESRVNGMVSGVVFERAQQLGMKMSREDAMLKGFQLFQQIKQSGKFDYPEAKFKAVAMGVGKWTEEGGLAAAEDILTAHGNSINTILSENDFMGLGALRAVKNAGKQGQIRIANAADGFKVALNRVKSGELLVTGPCSGEETGVGVVELINQMFAGKVDANNLPLGSYFRADIITKDNVDKWFDTANPKNQFYKYTIPPFKTVTQIRSEAAARK